MDLGNQSTENVVVQIYMHFYFSYINVMGYLWLLH